MRTNENRQNITIRFMSTVKSFARFAIATMFIKLQMHCMMIDRFPISICNNYKISAYDYLKTCSPSSRLSAMPKICLM